MEDAVARETAEMRSRTRPLGIIGNIAPLVGLLGTVVGMIFAFSTASRVGLGRADELAKGIYLALMTTAGGLTIAIPALLFAAWFNGRGERYMREIDETLLETMPCFASMENRIIETRIPAQASSEHAPQRLEPAEAT
jgi:biopolymer transport protein ExbB